MGSFPQGCLANGGAATHLARVRHKPFTQGNPGSPSNGYFCAATDGFKQVIGSIGKVRRYRNEVPVALSFAFSGN